jgi:hypothetical protein
MAQKGLKFKGRRGNGQYDDYIGFLGRMIPLLDLSPWQS